MTILSIFSFGRFCQIHFPIFQYIHVQPFSMDAEKPDYDLDEEDQKYVKDVLRGQKKFEIDDTTFEEMIDRLEKNSGHSVITAKEAKLLLKEDDDLILAVYDYWVEKRLRIKQPLLPTVKSDKRDIAHQTTPATPNLNNSSIQTPGSTGFVDFERINFSVEYVDIVNFTEFVDYLILSPLKNSLLLSIFHEFVDSFNFIEIVEYVDFREFVDFVDFLAIVDFLIMH